MHRLLLYSALLTTATVAHAQTRAINAPPPIPQDVTVVAPKDAKVTSTYPAEGASVPGGMVVIRVSFDQTMSPEGWSYTKSDKGRFPDCLSQPRLLADRRSFVLMCSLALNTTYAFDINASPAFETAAGRKPPERTVTFKTTTDINIGLHAALQSAGLGDDADPIMNEASTPGVVKSTPQTHPQG
jgi:hypothetical protein